MVLLMLAAVSVTLSAACADISTDPEIPATIEAAAHPSPSIAIGDVMRDTLGNEQPMRAIVRNMNGDVIEGATLNYMYVQYGRDSALAVDSTTGLVRVNKRPTGAPIQIAARYASALQILMPVRISNAPDTIFAVGEPHIVGFVPDTGVRGVDSNAVALDVQLQYRDNQGAFQNTSDWLVRFAVIQPANTANDTSGPVFLIDDNRRASRIDTSSSGGIASRRLRIRPLVFPENGLDEDTVIVEAMAWREGQPVAGGPLLIKIPVRSPATRGRE